MKSRRLHSLLSLLATPVWFGSFYTLMVLLPQNTSVAAPPSTAQDEEIEDWMRGYEESETQDPSDEASDQEFAARGFDSREPSYPMDEGDVARLDEDAVVENPPGSEGRPLFSEEDSVTGEYDVEPVLPKDEQEWPE